MIQGIRDITQPTLSVIFIIYEIDILFSQHSFKKKLPDSHGFANLQAI